LQSIPTTYKGIEFRARSEARWAVFFDKLGIRYLYEPLKVTPPDTGGYYPDFFFQDWRIYGEVKDLERDNLTFEEIGKMVSLVHALKVPLLLIDGSPHAFSSYLLSPDNTRMLEEYKNMEGDEVYKLADFREYLPCVAKCSIAWLPLHKRFDLVLGAMRPETTPGEDIENALMYAREFEFEK
jgi:hypothetical protein